MFKENTSKVAFKKKICGDIFGSSMGGENSMLGMLYRSRVQEKLIKSIKKDEDRSEETLVESKSTENIDVLDGSSDSENEGDEIANPRHRLALTIKNWSYNEANDEYLLTEGAVHALIALAGSEDHRIKQCCASALYQLSCRERNRSELLNLGSATGVITIAMSVRHWKIAKLCAQTLCNLSMEPNCEAVMAKEGAILALVILLSVRNQRLAPVCVQALYNLTCVENNFKGMERIVKALLTLPSVNFDATPSIVGAIVNCSRFPSLRNRIIEDGALQTFSAVVNSLGHRDVLEERDAVVYNISSSISQLSETVLCRGDMISKGTIELIQQILPYCNDKSRLLVMKALHNLLLVIETFPSTIFEIGVNVVTDVINQTFDETTLQYAAVCFHVFTRENMRGIPRLAIRMVKSLPRLLLCSNPISQYYAIITTSQMFFSELIADTTLLMVLAGKAVQAGYTVRDPATIRALAGAFAQLTQEDKYISELYQEKLLPEMLNLNLSLIKSAKNDDRVLESCCVSVCRICLHLRNIEPARRQEISQIYFDLLDNDDTDVLKNCISSIRALLENGICHDEMLAQSSLISRIANITVRYCDEQDIPRLGCAVLTVLSHDPAAHSGLSADDVLMMLFQLTRSDDIMTRELVATCICNISIYEDCRIRMIEKGVVDVIASLSGATSERIQELCARSICNLTCTVQMHPVMIKNNILQTTLMVSLVRSVSNSTKQLCARALLNMVSAENLSAIMEAGVIRAFSTLSLLEDSHTQYICARGFLMLSASTEGRETIVQKRTVLQSLFALVKALSGRTRVLMGMAIFNLLADDISRLEVIRAGALSVLKIISTLEYENLREGTARVIVILAQAPELERFIAREPVVSVLALILKTANRSGFECALNAFSCLSQSQTFRQILIEKGTVSALVGAVIEGKICTTDYANEVCRTLCLLSLSKNHADTIIVKEHALLALHVLYRSDLCCLQSAEMIAMFLRNLSCIRDVCKDIVEQEGLTMLRDLMKQHSSPILTSAAMLLFHNLSKDADLHVRLNDEGIMGMIKSVTGVEEDGEQMQETLDSDEELTVDGSVDSRWAAAQEREVNETVIKALQSETADVKSRRNGIPQDSCYDIVMTVQLLSLTPECRSAIVKNGSVVKVLFSILSGLNDVIRHEMVCSLCNLASSRDCREELVRQGAIELLVILSDSPYPDTQSQVATALGYLSENTVMKSGTCASLLLLSLKAEELRDSAASVNSQTRKSVLHDDEHNSQIAPTDHANVSAPAKELLALQNVKSLKVMIRDGLNRNLDKHGVVVTDADTITSNSKSVESFRGTSLEDLNEVGYLELTPQEQVALRRDYSNYEYIITTHPVSQEGGGVSVKKRVELPYPSVKIPYFDSDRHDVGDLYEIKVSRDSLPKNKEELKIVDGKHAASLESAEKEDSFKNLRKYRGKHTPATARQDKLLKQYSSLDDNVNAKDVK